MLDVGCSRVHILGRLATLYPKSQFLGIDLSEEAISYARAHASKIENNNIEFVAADLSNFDQTADPESFDFITTFDAIHDQARPLNVLKGIHQALKPHGVYLMQDISGSSHIHKDIEHPIGTFLYTLICTNTYAQRATVNARYTTRARLWWLTERSS